jgi:hypothetical protein
MLSHLHSLRQPPSQIRAVLTGYQSATAQRAAVEPLITMLNSRHAEPSLPAVLASLKLVGLPGITIQHLTAKRNKEGILLTMSGTVSDQTLSGTQARFEELGKRLTAIPGITLGTSNLEPAQQKFSMEARYTP